MLAPLPKHLTFHWALAACCRKDGFVAALGVGHGDLGEDVRLHERACDVLGVTSIKPCCTGCTFCARESVSPRVGGPSLQEGAHRGSGSSQSHASHTTPRHFEGLRAEQKWGKRQNGKPLQTKGQRSHQVNLHKQPLGEQLLAANVLVLFEMCSVTGPANQGSAYMAYICLQSRAPGTQLRQFCTTWHRKWQKPCHNSTCKKRLR